MSQPEEPDETSAPKPPPIPIPGTRPPRPAPTHRARYTIFNSSWVDMPEAEPRQRAALPSDEHPVVLVTVELDGSLTVPDGAEVNIEEVPEDEQ